MIPKISPKNSKLSSICPPSKVPDKYSPRTCILDQPSSQCIPFSQRQIGSCVAACTLHFGHRACRWKIHNMIVLVSPSHILNRNIALLVITRETESMVLDEFKVSLLPDNPPFMLPFELLEACYHCREHPGIWAAYLRIVNQFLPDIIGHILGCSNEDVIQRNIAVATTHRGIWTRCAVYLMATIRDTKTHYVV